MVQGDHFDCLNSRHPNDPNPYRRAFSDKNPQVEEFLKKLITWIKSWKICQENKAEPPYFSNFYLSIKSILLQWKELKKERTLYFLTSRLQQDPLENLFAVLRSRGGHNENPTTMSFRQNLQYTINANLSKQTSGSNCEEDGTISLLSVEMENDNSTASVSESKNRQILQTSSPNNLNLNQNSSNALQELDFDIVVDGPNDLDNINSNTQNNTNSQINLSPRSNVTSLLQCSMKYVAGYVAFKCLKTIKNCENCKEFLIRGNQNFEQRNDYLLFYKAYNISENFDLGNLCVPSDKCTEVVTSMYNIFCKCFPTDLHKKEISKILKNSIVDYIKFTHSCFSDVDEHCLIHRELIITFFIKVHIYYHLKFINYDIRDKNNRKKRLNNSDDNSKPNRKLKKITHKYTIFINSFRIGKNNV